MTRRTPFFVAKNEGRRLSVAKSAGLLVLADRLAPAEPNEAPNQPVDVRDLELICQLAVKTIGCANAMISVTATAPDDLDMGQIAVGTFCCIENRTRSQYATTDQGTPASTLLNSMSSNTEVSIQLVISSRTYPLSTMCPGQFNASSSSSSK